MTQFIAHAEEIRTFSNKKGATKAIKRDLGKHVDAHGENLSMTDYEVKEVGDSGRFGVLVRCNLTPEEAETKVSEMLSGYVIEVLNSKKTTSSRTKGQVTVAPTTPLIHCRAGSRQQALVDALATDNVWDQPFNCDDADKAHHGVSSLVGGVTLEDLRKVCIKKDGTPWSDNSIRSALYYDLKDKGYGTTTRFEDGVPYYSLVLPAGVKAPLSPKVKS